MFVSKEATQSHRPGLIGFVLLVFALLHASSGPSTGLTFDEIPRLSEVVAKASLAFRGRIVDLDYGHVEVSKEETIPYTRITLDVEQSFGGTRGSKVTLRQMGGRLRDHPTRYLVIPGLADLATGERIYVLANDRLQPFFATLYGDYSLFRIAQDEEGRRRVLNAHWQMLETDGQRIWPVRGRYCEASKENRSRCRSRSHTDGDTSDSHDVEIRKGKPLEPETLDALIERWRKGGQQAGVRGQTVSANDKTFTKALRDFGLSVSASGPNDDQNQAHLR